MEKTQTTEPSRAASLRRQLLWSNASFFVIWVPWMYVVRTTLETEAGLGLMAFTSIPILVVGTWAFVVDCRALWALWRWKGLLCMVGWGFAAACLNGLAQVAGALVTAGLLSYIYEQFGRQAAVAEAKREVLEN